MALTKSTKARAKIPEIDKLKLKLDVDMCDVLIKFSLCKYPSKLHLSNLNKLIGSLDIESYKTNYDIYHRLLMVKVIGNVRSEFGVTDLAIIKNSIIEADVSLSDMCEKIEWSDSLLTVGDCKMVNELVDEKLQYYYFYVAMPKIIKIWERCHNADFVNHKEVLKELNNETAKLTMQMQNTTIGTSLIRKFNFSNPDVYDVIKFIAEEQRKPSSILQTGMRQLNAILGPGFRGGKLYTFLGLSGKFKSGLLLNIADQITKFNPILERVEDGKRNTLLYITLENDIAETVERLYCMYAGPTGNFIKSSVDDIIDTIMNKGKFKFTDEMGIDIEIRYFTHFEIKTSAIYGIITDMEENGQHVIGLIVDYIKVIDSATPCNNDEIIRNTYVTRELKTIAEYFHIPVITAQQINRMGNSKVDAAMGEGKQDLIRLVGNSDIGGAWGVVEESDWIAVIFPERHIKTNQLYLSIKRTKQRAGSSDALVSDYFNHPFTMDSTIKLDTDVDKEYSLSIMSLASDLDTVDMNKLENISQERPHIVRHPSNSSLIESLYA